MLQEVVQCEECGREGSKDEIGICGDWLGTPEKGYACLDILCPDCRNFDEELLLEDKDDNEGVSNKRRRND